MEDINKHLQEKYRSMQKEVRYELIDTDDADVVLVAYGLAARICHSAVEMGRSKGLKLGLLRPKTLYPYPTEMVKELSARVKGMHVVELNSGQMVEDVRLAVNGRVPVTFFGRMGGMIPSPEEVLQSVEARIAQMRIEPREEQIYA
jgi:2-oxoglutarate ferredoxin oxidoreductase subunit alpha